MIIVEIGKNENIERALKTLKSKVIKTKQQKILFDRKELLASLLFQRIA